MRQQPLARGGQYVAHRVVDRDQQVSVYAGAAAVSLYVRAINNHGAAAVVMLFAVIPAVAAVPAWLMLGQRPDTGVAVGLVVGGFACWLSSRASGPRRVAGESAKHIPPLEASCAGGAGR